MSSSSSLVPSFPWAFTLSRRMLLQSLSDSYRAQGIILHLRHLPPLAKYQLAGLGTNSMLLKTVTPPWELFVFPELSLNAFHLLSRDSCISHSNKRWATCIALNFNWLWEKKRIQKQNTKLVPKSHRISRSTIRCSREKSLVRSLALSSRYFHLAPYLRLDLQISQENINKKSYVPAVHT